MVIILCTQRELAQGAELSGMYQNIVGDYQDRDLRSQGGTTEKGVEDLNINFKQICTNITSMTRTANQIQYIVIHDTGNRNRGANAEMHYRYFSGAYRGGSADFFVDDTQILQTNDYFKFRSWHCGERNCHFTQ